MRARLRLLSLVSLLFAACSEAPEGQLEGDGNAATARPDPDAPLVSHRPGAQLVFSLQEGWMAEKPTSNMRFAQYRLPAQADDSQAAELVVFYFGEGQGGSNEANLVRWAGQFEQPDGQDSIDVMRRSERSTKGMRVEEADLTGTYVAETPPGSGTRVNHAGWRMLASIIESDHGPYFVKLTGPEATVSHWSASYRKFVGEVGFKD